MLKLYRRISRIPRFPSSHSHSRLLYHVLAIETSCDDTTVALIDRPTDRKTPPILLEHSKQSLDNTHAGGIIPLDARNHHQAHLALMVREVLSRNNVGKPDLVAVTRGPGMIGSLSAGYSLAKGLCVAWDVPMVGVHHMVGHLLTPRFFQGAEGMEEGGAGAGAGRGKIPEYPFVSLLVSGGHTMLVLSRSALDHEILANTVDIALGDMLDKCARELGITGSMLGQEMETFINSGPTSTDTTATATATEEEEDHKVPKDFILPNPLQNKNGRQPNLAAYSFAAFITALRTAHQKVLPKGSPPLRDLPDPTRREIARRVQNAIFVHLASKTAMALEQAVIAGKIKVCGSPSSTTGSTVTTSSSSSSTTTTPSRPLDFVCAGGVASNMALRSILTETLAPFNMTHYYPPPKWCTDNALMIGWAGIEFWEQGLQTDLSALPTAKWPISELMDYPGWIRQ